MKEVLSCRVTLDEKRLVQAWAARRGECVAHVIREQIMAGVRAEFGMEGAPVPVGEESPGD